MAIQREDKIEQSVQDYLSEQLFNVRGYPESQVEITDAWSGEPIETPLLKNIVAVGFNFDDGGKLAELGSTFVRRLYTIEFFIFAKSATWGRNLAAAVQGSLENDLIIPLKDIGEPGQPLIDTLPVISVSSQRQVIPDPAPWQKFVWTVHLRVEDSYYAMV